MNASNAAGRRTLALRAFPPRWRERHGDELLYVSGEMATSDDHATWGELFDIVRGGITVRFEDRPPLRIRAAYRWFEKPVPPKWHAWMRDDLRSWSFGYRRNLQAMFPVWLFFLFAVLVGPSGRTQALVTFGILLVFFVASGPFQARRVRKRMNAKLGYDIVAAGPFPPPTPEVISVPVPRLPARRMPYVVYAVPLAAWSLIAGPALITGAAISNAPNRSIGPITFSPDPNSPLTADQVAAIAIVVGLAAIVLAVVAALVTRWRVSSFAAATVHESVPLRSANAWIGTSLIGAPATIIGALGVMPDLACAVIGSALVLAGAAAGVAAMVVARRDRELGRHISLAELFVGERDPSTLTGPQTAGSTER